jgi:hypothetical protein
MEMRRLLEASGKSQAAAAAEVEASVKVIP